MSVAPPSATADQGGTAPLTVVIVDDSAVQRRFARAALEADPGVSVVGEARNGRDAVQLVERLRPHAVLMDLHLPVMNGLEAIERIMAVRPTPILVYSSFVDGEDRDNATAALAAGAVDVMQKPAGGSAGVLEEYAAALRNRIRIAGRVKVITHPRARLTGPSATMSTRRLAASAHRTPVATVASSGGSVAGSRADGCGVADLAPRRVQVIAIGASTGGPQALALVLAELPADLEAAVVVVQHMADGFVEGLAGWLDELCPLPVTVGANGQRLAPGSVTIAPSGLNLVVHDRLRVTTYAPPSSQYHVPGIDVTFGSVADAVGAAAVGVLLTGMGRDGALGLKSMRDRGAFTIAQDEESSAVYGMPAAAVAAGAVDLQVPLSEVGPALRRLVVVPAAGA